MATEPQAQSGSVLRAVVWRLLGSEHWCESWAYGCPLDSSLAVLERVAQLSPVLPSAQQEAGASPPAGG